jgi:hypothetical protein
MTLTAVLVGVADGAAKDTVPVVCVPAPPVSFYRYRYRSFHSSSQKVRSVAKVMCASARNSPRTLRPRTSSSSDSSRQVAHWLQLGTGKDGVLEASAWMSRSSLHDSQWVAGPARRSPFGGSIAYRSQIIPQQQLRPATAPASQYRAEDRQTFASSTSSLSSSVHEMVLSLHDQHLARERARFFPQPRTSSSNESPTRIVNWLQPSDDAEFTSTSKTNLLTSSSKSASLSSTMSSKLSTRERRLEPLCEPTSLHDPISRSSRATALQIDLLSRRRYAARLGKTREASFNFRSSFPQFN